MDKSNDKFVWLKLFHLILIKAVRTDVTNGGRDADITGKKNSLKYLRESVP